MNKKLNSNSLEQIVDEFLQSAFLRSKGGNLMSKSIAEQIETTQTGLEKAETTLTQLNNKKNKIITRNKNAERKARSRNLIQRGAILESINPLFRSLSNEQVQAYLQRVLRTEGAKKLLEEMAQANLT